MAALAVVTQAAVNEVCMVNDKVSGKPQIPVEFEGKTYYGCCQGCVKRINEDRTVRYSTEPLTGREVDKATAFIVEGRGEMPSASNPLRQQVNSPCAGQGPCGIREPLNNYVSLLF